MTDDLCFYCKSQLESNIDKLLPLTCNFLLNHIFVSCIALHCLWSLALSFTCCSIWIWVWIFCFDKSYKTPNKTKLHLSAGLVLILALCSIWQWHHQPLATKTTASAPFAPLCLVRQQLKGSLLTALQSQMSTGSSCPSLWWHSSLTGCASLHCIFSSCSAAFLATCSNVHQLLEQFCLLTYGSLDSVNITSESTWVRRFPVVISMTSYCTPESLTQGCTDALLWDKWM